MIDIDIGRSGCKAKELDEELIKLFFDPISWIYPHDPPHEDRANGHIGALYCQMSDML